MNPEIKTVPEKPCSRFFWENSTSTKRFSAQPKGYTTSMVAEGYWEANIEAFFQVMRVAVIYRKWRKFSKKIALHLRSTLGVPPIYEGTYSEKVSLASPGNSMGGTNGSFFCLFNRKKSMGVSTSLEKTCFFWRFLAMNPWEMFARCRNLMKTRF